MLSEAGVASRRGAEQLMTQGRVLVNGRIAELGLRIDPSVDRVTVDGSLVQIDPDKTYLMLNKPAGVVTTARDPQRRPTVTDIVGVESRVFPVGRLDMATEGLLLLTNDGDLAFRLSHPSFEVPKVYVAEVNGSIGRAIMRRLTVTGVDLGDKEPFQADEVKVLGSRKGGGTTRTVVELTLHEGPKHVVRRLLEEVGCPVIRLVRTGLGPLRLNRLSSGTYRLLSREEVASLYREVGL
ncbi:MAG: pseudouridine synthase [Actinomycetota bacterium]